VRSGQPGPVTLVAQIKLAGWTVKQKIRQVRFLARVWVRFAQRMVGRQSDGMPLTAASLCANIINLPEREDRRKAVSNQFDMRNIKYRIVAATQDSYGALGCAISHRNLLASITPGEVIWVCEDDLAYDVDEEMLFAVVDEFLSNDALDVLCLSHMTKSPILPISKMLALTASTMTTASYLAKPRARDALHDCFDRAAIMLALGFPKKVAAIDVQWKALQREKLVFAVPRIPLAHQAASYSDVENIEVDYYPGRKDESPLI